MCSRPLTLTNMGVRNCTTRDHATPIRLPTRADTTVDSTTANVANTMVSTRNNG